MTLFSIVFVHDSTSYRMRLIEEKRYRGKVADKLERWYRPKHDGPLQLTKDSSQTKSFQTANLEVDIHYTHIRPRVRAYAYSEQTVVLLLA